MAKHTSQLGLNFLASTTNKSPQECLNILASATGTRYSKQQAWNIYAGTTGLKQEQLDYQFRIAFQPLQD